MKRVDLVQVHHDFKVGDQTPDLKANVTEDSVFYINEKAIGFYMRSVPENMVKIANIANKELRSDNVPKSIMARGREKDGVQQVLQYSTIIGSIVPKPHMRRPYPSISSVHSVKSAKLFIKAMLNLAIESEKLIEKILPEQYAQQVALFEKVPEQWRFGNLFTSSISNFNISAPYHKDSANIVGAVNVIITKRENSEGGNLHVPDYGAVIDQCDNSILVYPAYLNLHGVTPINPTKDGGYRNSLVFYPLKGFVVNDAK